MPCDLFRAGSARLAVRSATLADSAGAKRWSLNVRTLVGASARGLRFAVEPTVRLKSRGHERASTPSAERLTSRP